MTEIAEALSLDFSVFEADFLANLPGAVLPRSTQSPGGGGSRFCPALSPLHTLKASTGGGISGAASREWCTPAPRCAARRRLGGACSTTDEYFRQLGPHVCARRRFSVDAVDTHRAYESVFNGPDGLCSRTPVDLRLRDDVATSWPGSTDAMTSCCVWASSSTFQAHPHCRCSTRSIRCCGRAGCS